MKLRREAEVSTGDDVQVVSMPLGRHLLLLSFMGAAVIGLFVFAAMGGYESPKVHLGPKIVTLMGVVLGLVTLIGMSDVKSRMQPTNWQLKGTARKLFIKFRSYRNHHLPMDELTVIELDGAEVKALQKHVVHEITKRRARSRERQHRWRTYLEIETHEPLDPTLANMLLRESKYLDFEGRDPSIRQAWNECTVKILDERKFALEYFGRPPIDELLQSLGRDLTVLPAKKSTLDKSGL